MSEKLEGRDYEMDGAAVGYKPAGWRHENRWGSAGVLIFSINLPLGCDALPEAPRRPGWSSLARGLPIREMVRACFGPEELVRRDVIQDALALVCVPEESSTHAQPWLVAARETLTEEPEITVEALARSAGVHRAHFTRAFQRCYGVPPSVHRRRVLAARAIEGVARNETALSRIAHEAGFSDHSHMSRTLKFDTGLTPADLRRLLRQDITSVQDHF